MAGGTQHEHIETLWWEQVSADGKTVVSQGQSSREQMVDYIEKNGNASVYCPDRDPSKSGAWVHVHSNGRISSTFRRSRTTARPTTCSICRRAVCVRRTHLEIGLGAKDARVHFNSGGHVDTIGSKDATGRRRRRLHSDEFKADAIAAAAQPGMSMAAVAMARGIKQTCFAAGFAKPR